MAKQNSEPLLFYRSKPIQEEPKFHHRFVVEFPEEFNLHSYLVQSVSPPIWENNKWGEMTIIFIDVLSKCNSSSMGLMNMINFSKKHKPETFLIKIKILGPVGEITEEWLIAPLDFKVIFSNFEYDNKNLMTHKLIVYPAEFTMK